MKARISTNRCRCYQCYPADLEAEALNEARAILAETEPTDPGGLRMCAHLHTGWRSPADITARALAESLAAFVEE